MEKSRPMLPSQKAPDRYLLSFSLSPIPPMSHPPQPIALAKRPAEVAVQSPIIIASINLFIAPSNDPRPSRIPPEARKIKAGLVFLPNININQTGPREYPRGPVMRVIGDTISRCPRNEAGMRLTERPFLTSAWTNSWR